MQRGWWHRCQGFPEAQKSSGGNDHLDDAAGFHIQRQIGDFAELFILIVVHRHADDIGGFGRAAPPLAAGLNQVLLNGIGFNDGLSKGILPQRGERQKGYRRNVRNNFKLFFMFNALV